MAGQGCFVFESQRRAWSRCALAFTVLCRCGVGWGLRGSAPWAVFWFQAAADLGFR